MLTKKESGRLIAKLANKHESCYNTNNKQLIDNFIAVRVF